MNFDPAIKFLKLVFFLGISGPVVKSFFILLTYRPSGAGPHHALVRLREASVDDKPRSQSLVRLLLEQARDCGRRRNAGSGHSSGTRQPTARTELSVDAQESLRRGHKDCKLKFKRITIPENCTPLEIC